MLPTFLGIAALKAGTTWLHALLEQHPDVYVPSRRKEVRFFDLDKNYRRGLCWYEQFFPTDDQANRYKAIGEITPHYMFRDYVPGRIAELGTVKKLIVMLRDPIDRFYSHYRWTMQVHNYRGSLRSFLEERPVAIDYSMYAKHLKNVLEYFRMDQILVLIFEEVFHDVEKTKETVAGFLDVDASRFPGSAGYRVENKGVIPKFRTLHYMVGKATVPLRRRGWDWPVNVARRMGVEKLFGKGGPPGPLDKNTRELLAATFAPDVQELESLLGRKLSCWQYKRQQE